MNTFNVSFIFPISCWTPQPLTWRFILLGADCRPSSPAPQKFAQQQAVGLVQLLHPGSGKDSKCIIPRGYWAADKGSLKGRQFTPEDICATVFMSPIRNDWDSKQRLSALREITVGQRPWPSEISFRHSHISLTSNHSRARRVPLAPRGTLE